MAGRKKTYVIELTADEEAQLAGVVSSRKSRQGEAQRARIVLTCAQHPEWSDERVGEQVGSAPNTVRKWRRRWSQTRSIKEAPRPGRPRVFSP